MTASSDAASGLDAGAKNPVPRGAAMAGRLPALKHLVNHLGVTVASKFIPIASIFVYSRLMDVSDYGVLNLFTSYLWIFVIAMSLNLHTGIGRYIYTEDADFGRFLGTSLLAVSAIFSCASILVVWRLETVAQALGLPRQTILLMLAVALGQIAESTFTQIAIFHQHSGQLLRVVTGKAFGTFALGIGLLMTMEHDKYLAVLYAETLASLLLTAYALWCLRSDVRWEFSVSHLKYMARYALPLIPYMLSLTLLSQFDRVMIDRHFGKEATGLYSLSYNIGGLLLMVVTALLNAFNPAFFDALNRKDHARVARDANAIFGLAVLATGVLVLFGPELAVLIAPAKYASSFDLIPVVAIGGLCFVTFQVWVRVIAYANRTYLISAIAVVATAVNIGLNWWLLPIWGYKVAALTTLVAYLAMSLLCVAAANTVVRAMRIRVLPDLAYVAALGAVLLCLRAAALPELAGMVVKGILLALLAWHLLPQLKALIRAGRAGSVGA